MKKLSVILSMALCVLLVNTSVQLSFATSTGQDRGQRSACSQWQNQCQSACAASACTVKTCNQSSNKWQSTCTANTCSQCPNSCGFQAGCQTFNLWGCCQTPVSDIAGYCPNTGRPTVGNKPATDTDGRPGTDTESSPIGGNSTAGNTAGSNSTGSDTSTVSDYAGKVAEITNEERKAQNISALTIDDELCRLAQIKAQDMADKNYFSHTSPTYGSAGDMLKTAGYSYKAVGENIAKGQQTPSTVMAAWMNSGGHKANILGNYTKIGVGYTTSANGTTYWVQIFAR